MSRLVLGGENRRDLVFCSMLFVFSSNRFRMVALVLRWSQFFLNQWLKQVFPFDRAVPNPCCLPKTQLGESEHLAPPKEVAIV